MYRTTKVATCCYCGTRATLVLGEGRHELACTGCGAPLSNLKNIPGPQPQRIARDAGAAGFAAQKPKKKKRGKKKSKPRFRRLFGEILDEIEDIFD